MISCELRSALLSPNEVAYENRSSYESNLRRKGGRSFGGCTCQRLIRKNGLGRAARNEEAGVEVEPRGRLSPDLRPNLAFRKLCTGIMFALPALSGARFPRGSNKTPRANEKPGFVRTGNLGCFPCFHTRGWKTGSLFILFSMNCHGFNG